MGKEWYWGGRSSSKRSGKGGTETDIPSGCMCAVFQAFDFHPFHFSINQQQQTSFKFSSHIPNDHTLPKGGVEAPRNSLESEDGTISSISKEESFKIPKNIRTKTSGSTRTKTESFNDLCSPGTKTPTLVARLMGLDLLPDANSPSSSSSSSLSTPNKQGHSQYHHYHHLNRPKQDIKIMKHRHSTDSVMRSSLPETPRLSSSERRLDVEHRLSLQINKENRSFGDDLESPRISFSKRKFDENNNSTRSPSHYARQIVKQVKESVSRKVGLDITNTVKNRENSNTNTNTSHSPRLSRFNDINHKHSHSHSHSPISTSKDQNTFQVLKQSSPPPIVNIEAHVSRVSTKLKTQAMSEKDIQKKKSFPKCKKTEHRSLSPRINKPPQTTTSSITNKQQESFIIRPSSSTTRANDIKAKSKRTRPLSNNTVPNLLHVKTHPSTSAIKIHQKQVNDDDVQETKNMSQLFSSSRHKYNKQESINKLFTRGTTNTESKSITVAEDERSSEYQYITTILSRIEIHRATILNLNFQWFSSTHPLDPSLFHRLELNPTFNSFVSNPKNDKDCIFTQKNHLGPRCNRRLVFDLVDEVLSEILVKPKCCHRGLLLLETVWKRVNSFPRAKCEVLEDIDGLIEMKDVMDKNKEEEEESEILVAEIEEKVLEMLVNETLTVMVVGPYEKDGVVLDDVDSGKRGDMKQRLSHGIGFT